MMDKVPMPDVRPREDGLYEVVDDWSVRVQINDVPYLLTVQGGFTFDGASIPRILWRLCGGPFAAPRVAAALAHDWLYAAQVTDRESADRVYLNLQKRMGIASIKRRAEYYALRMFGWAAWDSVTSHERADARDLGRFEVAITKEVK